MVHYTTDYLRLRSKSDDSKQSGLDVDLYQSGVKIADLTQDTGTTWQYNYPAAIVNGVYDLYVGGSPALNNGVQIQVKVVRGGNVDTDDIVDLAVSRPKVNFLAPGDNLFDPNNPNMVLEDQILNNGDNSYPTPATNFLVFKIPVEESTQYKELGPTPNYGAYYHFYDSDFVWISRTAEGTGFTTPAGCAFMARNVASSAGNWAAAKSTYMLVKSATAPPYYKPYAAYLADEDGNKYPANIPFKDDVSGPTDAPDYDGQIGVDDDKQVYAGIPVGNGAVNQIPIATIHQPNNNILELQKLWELVNSQQNELRLSASTGSTTGSSWLNVANNVTVTPEDNDSGVVDSGLVTKKYKMTPTSVSSPYFRTDDMYASGGTLNSFVFGIWIDKTQLLAWINALSALTANAFYWGLHTGTFTTQNITGHEVLAFLANTGYQRTGSVTGVMNYDYIIRMPVQCNGWVYFEFVYYNCSGTPSYLYWYFNFSGYGSGPGSMPITFLAPRCIFNVLETHPFAVHTDYGTSVSRSNAIDRKYFEENIGGFAIRDKIRIYQSGNDNYIRSYFDETRDVVQKIVYAPSNNKNWQLQTVRLIAYDAEDSTAVYGAGTDIHGVGDDICPHNTINLGYVGGNHGFNTREIVASSHGKDASDLGSIWSDGTNQWYLAEVIDANNLTMLGVADTSTGTWVIPTSLAGNPLTHVSGASHTGNITWTGSTAVSQVAVCGQRSFSILVDGKYPLEDGVLTYGEFVDFKEEYTVPDPDDLVFADPMDWSNGNSDWFTNTIIYRFGLDGSLVIFHTVELHKEMKLGYIGLMQFYKLTQGSYSNIYLYIPGADTVNDGSKDWTVNDIMDFNTDPASSLYWGPTEKLYSNPPNRSIMFLGNGSPDDVAFMGAYNPVFSQSKDATRDSSSDYWNLYTSGKQYPRFLNSNSIYPAGTVWNGVMMRHYFNPTRASANVTSANWIKIGSFWLVYIDYHQTVSWDRVELPGQLIGLSITVVDKTTSFTLEIDDYVPPDGLFCTVTTAGWAILKLQ